MFLTSYCTPKFIREQITKQMGVNFTLISLWLLFCFSFSSFSRPNRGKSYMNSNGTT